MITDEPITLEQIDKFIKDNEEWYKEPEILIPFLSFPCGCRSTNKNIYICEKHRNRLSELLL